MTKVINLFAGPGVGKSTLAAEIYHKLKCNRESAELVREYVKDWAWEERDISQFDQFYIMGKQMRKEYPLYNKVDYIVTDSPILMCAFYQEYYSGTQLTVDFAKKFMYHAKDNGIEYYNFWLSRDIDYRKEGRFQTEEEAKSIDTKMLSWLNTYNIPLLEVRGPLENRADHILGSIIDK